MLIIYMLDKKCTVSSWLAYLMLIYLVSSLYYILVTRFMGTPFNDSLTEEQVALKSQASWDRGKVFTQGVLLGLLIVYLYKPFDGCYCVAQ